MSDARDEYLDKIVVVGITHQGADGGQRLEQLAGTIDRFEDRDGAAAMILLCHDGVERALPWDADALEPVAPGLYRLADGGAIRDPDYIIQFAVEDDGTAEGPQ